MIVSKAWMLRWVLSLLLLWGVWSETGWFTVIAIGLGMAATEVQTFMWKSVLNAEDRDGWVARIRKL